MRRYLSLIILVPLAIVLIAFSVANRHMVLISLDPMNVEDPALALNLPVFAIVFGALAIGLVVGGIATWFTQAKHRRLARNKRQEADKWRFEAEKQKEEQKQARFGTSTDGSPSFPVLPSSKAV